MVCWTFVSLILGVLATTETQFVFFHIVTASGPVYGEQRNLCSEDGYVVFLQNICKNVPTL